MNRTALTLPLCATALLLTLTACSQTTDLGFTCEMTGPKCEGVPAGEECPIVNLSPDKVTDPELGYPILDYVSEGVAECDDLVCLRSRNRRYEDTTAAAMGYCTAPCQTNDDCSPDFEGKKKTLVCKQLRPEGVSGMEEQDTQAKYCVLPETEGGV